VDFPLEAANLEDHGPRGAQAATERQETRFALRQKPGAAPVTRLQASSIALKDQTADG